MNHTRTSSSILLSQLSRSRHFTTILTLHLLYSMIPLGFKVNIEKKKDPFGLSFFHFHTRHRLLVPCNTTSQENKTNKGGGEENMEHFVVVVLSSLSNTFPPLYNSFAITLLQPFFHGGVGAKGGGEG